MAASITWYAKLEGLAEFEETTDFYAGSYDSEHEIKIDLQIWNNRYGKTNVSDLTSFDLVFYFDNIEDTALYDYCTVMYNGSALPFSVSGYKAVVDLPSVTLYGYKNNGTLEQGSANCLQLQFVFNAHTARLKTNDLKSLYFEVLPR